MRLLKELSKGILGLILLPVIIIVVIPCFCLWMVGRLVWSGITKDDFTKNTKNKIDDRLMG